MLTKKYASLNTLQTFFAKLKSLFATKIEVENAVAQKSQVKIIAPEGTQTLSTLQIHKLAQEEYDQKVANGEIDETAIYLTPDEEIDLSIYATTEYVDSKDPYEILENGHVVFEKDVLANQNISLQKTSTELGALKTSVGNLKNYWQYSESTTDVIRAINQNAEWVLANFEQHANKIQNIFDYSTDETKYPSAKATYDLMKFVYDLVMPVVIYDNPTGFEANDKNVGSWSLTGLDLTPYKRVKFYIKAAESGSTGSPSHIVELHLDDRARNSQGHFTGGHTSIFPDVEGKFHNVVCSVSEDKTAVAFNKAYRYSASTAATSSGGRCCYLIEGYFI